MIFQFQRRRGCNNLCKSVIRSFVITDFAGYIAQQSRNQKNLTTKDTKKNFAGKARSYKFVLRIMDKETELETKEDKIIIKPIKKKPRKEWKEAFGLMRKREENTLLINDSIDREMEDSKSKEHN